MIRRWEDLVRLAEARRRLALRRYALWKETGHMMPIAEDEKLLPNIGGEDESTQKR